MKPKCPIIRAKCPEKDLEHGGCPAWWELVIENAETKQEEVWKGCGLSMMPRLLLGVAKGASQAAASVQSARNVVAAGFQGLAEAAGLSPVCVVQRIQQADEATTRGVDLIERGQSGLERETDVISEPK
ncbi:MAG: hypothetical protein ACE5JS_08785 [Nitrospinota bacterium]